MITIISPIYGFKANLLLKNLLRHIFIKLKLLFFGLTWINSENIYGIKEKVQVFQKKCTWGISVYLARKCLHFFSSVYKTPNANPNNLENLSIDHYSHLPSIVSISLEDILEGLINGLYKSRYKGSDEKVTVLLFQCYQALSTPLLLLFNKSL